jgi:hypothetical protein
MSRYGLRLVLHAPSRNWQFGCRPLYDARRVGTVDAGDTTSINFEGIK